MARYLLLAFVVALALQGSSGSLHVQQLLESKIAEVRNATQKVISNVEAAVDNVREKVETGVQAAVTNVNTKVAALVADLKEHVSGLAQKATGEGKAVVTCVETLPKEIASLAENITQDAIACVKKPVDDARSIIETLVKLAKDANSTFVDSQTALTACGKETGSVERAVCSFAALSSAATKLAPLVPEVTEAVTAATDLFSSFEGITTCESSVWDAAPTEVKSVITDATKCFEALPSAA